MKNPALIILKETLLQAWGYHCVQDDWFIAIWTDGIIAREMHDVFHNALRKMFYLLWAPAG